MYLMAAAGCSATNSELASRMEDFNPTVRIRAILEVIRQQRQELLPELVNCLDDEDSAVRIYAILALEKFTGTRLEYSYASGSSARRKAIEGWREYLTQNHSSGEDQAPSESEPRASSASFGG